MKFINKYKKLIREMVLYGIIGVISSSTDALTFYIFIKLSIPMLLSNFISTNIGITISFLLNSFINFKKTDKLLKRAISFYMVGYFGLLLSTVILYIFVEKLGFNEMLVKIVSIVLVAIIQYILNKFLTYRGGSKNEKNI